MDFCNTLHESLNQLGNMAFEGKLDGINTGAGVYACSYFKTVDVCFNK